MTRAAKRQRLILYGKHLLSLSAPYEISAHAASVCAAAWENSLSKNLVAELERGKGIQAYRMREKSERQRANDLVAVASLCFAIADLLGKPKRK